jgi:hypothetical protein
MGICWQLLHAALLWLSPNYPLAFSMAASKPPSPLVVKLQILGVFCVPLVLLGLWLQGKGFW